MYKAYISSHTAPDELSLVDLVSLTLWPRMPTNTVAILISDFISVRHQILLYFLPIIFPANLVVQGKSKLGFMPEEGGYKAQLY